MEYGDCITTDRKIGRFYMNFNLSFLNKLKNKEHQFGYLKYKWFLGVER